MATVPNASSPLGLGLAWTYCTAVLPFYDPVTGSTLRAVTAIQPPLGLGTDPRTGAVLPSVVAGKPLLAQAIIRRISTPRGTLPDFNIPTTLGQYGVDISDAAYADITTQDSGEIAARVDAQVQMDERVVSSVTQAPLVGDTLMVAIQMVSTEGPVRLTLAIDTLNQNLSVLSSPT